MSCILSSLHVSFEQLHLEELAGESYLMFDSEPLGANVWNQISRHSACCMAAELTPEGFLRPIQRVKPGFLCEELPHVLKYKGKTNPDFTYMMLHCAKAASKFAETDELTVFDPMCGKGTSLFCALHEGYHAIGMDTDVKALAEADTYFERFLQGNRLKYKRAQAARTLLHGGSAQGVRYEISQNAEAQKNGLLQSAEWYCADASKAGEALKKNCCHLLICDLPYGIQHAPKDCGRMSTLIHLMKSVLPGCVQVLKPGGAMAFSFNQNTLKRQELESILTQNGMNVMSVPPYNDFSHWVEQAVTRDLVIATKE